MNYVVKLQQQVSALHQENGALHQKLEQRDVLINALKEKLRLMQTKQFGSSSEKASATQGQ